MGAVWCLGPDESTYIRQANTIRERGFIAGMRLLADRYNSEPLPTPLRWLWIAITAMFMPISSRFVQLVSLVLIGPIAAEAFASNWSGRAAIAIVCGLSPLACCVGKSRLQDVHVAALTLCCFEFSLRHDPALLGFFLFLLISVRETSVLALPAIATTWLVTGGALHPLIYAVAIAGIVTVAVMWFVFGRRFIPLVRKYLRTKNTDYQRQHNGPVHGLLVSLAITSPIPLVVACYAARDHVAIAATVLVYLATFSLFPIRNPRFIIAGDILIRVIAALAVPRWAIPIIGIADLWTIYRLRHVYDPMPDVLAAAVGMPKLTAK
jgi:hypothetical protein